MSDEKLLTINEVAEYLRRHPRTIRRWIKAGKLKAQPIPGRGRVKTEYRIRESDLKRLLEGQEQ